MPSKGCCVKTAILDSLWWRYGTWCGCTCTHADHWSARQSRSNEDSQWPPTLGSLCVVTPRSALSSWGLSLAQKDRHHVRCTYSGVAAGTHLNGHMAGLSTDGAGTREGVRCRGEAAHAEVTNWNNGADERQSCLCFREEDYWTSRSPFCIGLESPEMGGRGN